MPQPKQSRPSSSPRARAAGAAKPPAAKRTSAKPAASKPAAANRATTAKPAAAKPAAAKRATASKRSPAKPAATRATAAKRAPARSAPANPAPTRSAAKKRTAAKPSAAPRATAKGTTAGRDDALLANLAMMRDVLARGVVITAERIQETMDDAVKGGHMTREHGQTLTHDLIAAGRRQSDELRRDIESLVGRGRTAATQSGDRVLREVDRARRRVGVGPSFPISLYDDLGAAQVQGRLADLTKPELRMVRDHEARTAKRKSVLDAIERRLGG